ncbi:response regulator transcription factor [Sphingomonas astaxanthinifaciens]|uniref:DNA-binding response regulator n=1 Tax=Sphingomonas astaxanthinifaciens DSM 22298 TaxID=1123267 RepID=A0ABQ5Z6X8_9SPHN|nr:response regulator transcription factor [Sphingomonas astaxanthinifaciens]GLR47766.1 DNA-binding response regulator [Sphingomonas astaxanthinifaciens DSM 22298]
MSAGRRLVIVEDDEDFARTLARSFERRGYAVSTAFSPNALEALLAQTGFDFAVVDLKLGVHSGLPCVAALAEANPDTRIVVLTGFASIATAVEAIKLGAAHYLPKPSNTDDIEAAFGRVAGDADVPVDGRATSIKTLEWEKINETLIATGFNISETARRLGMHRRTLARKLEKRPVR